MYVTQHPLSQLAFHADVPIQASMKFVGVELRKSLGQLLYRFVADSRTTVAFIHLAQRVFVVVGALS